MSPDEERYAGCAVRELRTERWGNRVRAGERTEGNRSLLSRSSQLPSRSLEMGKSINSVPANPAIVIQILPKVKSTKRVSR